MADSAERAATGTVIASRHYSLSAIRDPLVSMPVLKLLLKPRFARKFPYTFAMRFSADPKTILRDPIHVLAFGFGAGLSPIAPGTCGTLIAVPLIMFIASFGFTAQALATLVICVSGVYICGTSATKLGVHDHQGIVWDEIAGFAITMLAVPLAWYWLLTGFLLFRLFDIVKPWPIREADHSLRGGLGIMLDDVIAGVFAGVVLYALNKLI